MPTAASTRSAEVRVAKAHRGEPTEQSESYPSLGGILPMT